MTDAEQTAHAEQIAALEKRLSWFEAAHSLLANEQAFIAPPEQSPFFMMPGHFKDGTPALSLNMNDVFWWGTADAEGFEYADAPKLLEIARRDGATGLIAWVMEKRAARGEADWDARHVERYTPELPLLQQRDAAEARAAALETKCTELRDRLIASVGLAEQISKETEARADAAEARALAAERESAGRLTTLNEKAEEARREWLRAEAAEANLAAAERERDEARKALADHKRRIADKDFDGEGKCDYCHGVGACPRCWGRAGITVAEAENKRLTEALRRYMSEHDKLKADAMGPEYSTVECDCDLCCNADAALAAPRPPEPPVTCALCGGAGIEGPDDLLCHGCKGSGVAECGAPSGAP